MPTSNTARKYKTYPDDDDYQAAATSYRPRPNIAFREVGSGGQITRKVAPPQPLSGTGPRRATLNLPTPDMYGYADETFQRGATPRQAMVRRPVVASKAMPRVNLSLGSSNMKLGLMAVGVIVVLVVSYLVVSFAVHTWQVWQDDMTYGRPRITRLEANVGHNEVGGTKTLFIAQNVNGQISISEFPGGDPTKTRVIVGPTLFGKERELVPIKLSVKDVNMDGQPDLVVNADTQQMIYINDNGSFRPINVQEQAKLKTQEKGDNN
jgi:hypothetical protein